MRPTAFLIASMYSPVRQEPTCGISKAAASSSVETVLPATVGTSPSVTRTVAPKHSASTERSIRLTLAAASVRLAINSMARA